MDKNGVAILGVFVADLTFRAGKMPAIGETIAGSGFAVGPGGKGSNQAVAAARAGSRVTFISRIGSDAFGELAHKTWKADGIQPRVTQTATAPTGAAFIYVHETRGDNAIIIVAGAAMDLCAADVDAAADAIRASRVFVTQLEQPVDAARRGLEIARAAGCITVLNPAPAIDLDDAVLALSDYVVPNESEAEALPALPGRPRRRSPRRRRPACQGRRYRVDHARRAWRAVSRERPFGPYRALFGWQGGRDDRRRGRLRRRRSSLPPCQPKRAQWTERSFA